ncbi:MAG: GNAT family N-acetyltransferase [Anaerolineae bacterium]|nr:GNAT family N-acetyltransferase [Anaerolineae bacterium]
MNIRTLDEGRTHKRELLIDDQVVSWLWVIDYQMRIGAAQVRMAGIGGVNTDWRHRMKGHMRTLFEDTVHYMIAEGYDVSMLFGIEDFYTKFGYASCLPSHKQTVHTRDAEGAPGSRDETTAHTWQPLEPQDMEAVLALYNRNNAARTGAIVRSKEDFHEFSKGTWWGTPPEAFVLKDQAGQVLAYAVCDRSNKAVNVVEIESVNEALFGTMMATFAGQAIEKRCGYITFYLPPDHAFAEYAQRFGCKWEVECPKNGGGMMRILNLQSTLNKIRPELQRRIAAAALQAPGRSLGIETDIGVVEFTIESGKLELDFQPSAASDVHLSQDKLTQMLVGYRRPRDVLNDPAVRARAGALPWLEALFPTCHAFVWHADHF